MKMNAVASSRAIRSDAESLSWAFAAHTNADHAHHTSARISIARPNPAQLRWRESSVVTWVIANTNTKSNSSSIGRVRRSEATGAPVANLDSAVISATAEVSLTGSGGLVLALPGRALAAVLERSLLALDPFQRALVLVVAADHAGPRPSRSCAQLGRPVGISGAGTLAPAAREQPLVRLDRGGELRTRQLLIEQPRLA